MSWFWWGRKASAKPKEETIIAPVAPLTATAAAVDAPTPTATPDPHLNLIWAATPVEPHTVVEYDIEPDMSYDALGEPLREVLEPLLVKEKKRAHIKVTVTFT